MPPTQQHDAARTDTGILHGPERAPEVEPTVVDRRERQGPQHPQPALDIRITDARGTTRSGIDGLAPGGRRQQQDDDGEIGELHTAAATHAAHAATSSLHQADPELASPDAERAAAADDERGAAIGSPSDVGADAPTTALAPDHVGAGADSDSVPTAGTLLFWVESSAEHDARVERETRAQAYAASFDLAGWSDASARWARSDEERTRRRTERDERDRRRRRREKLGAIIAAASLAAGSAGLLAAALTGDGDPAAQAADAGGTGPAPIVDTPVQNARPGDLVLTGIDGTTASSELKQRIREGRVAGVVLMGRNISSAAQVKRLTRSLQASAEAGGRLPLLITVDQEGGDVKRFANLHPTSSARTMGGLAPAAVQAQGRETGRDLAARGVNVDLAPVADIKRTADSFLGSRAFGISAGRVTEAACAFASGLRGAGVLPTLKHFPGLGAAGAVSTDDRPVTIGLPKDRLARHWEPFTACGRGDATLVMMSSATYPALDAAQPAVLSPAAYGAARELGLPGPFITDDVDAGALRSRERVASRAVEAGANLVLSTSESGAEAAERDIRARVSQQVLDARAAAVRRVRRALAG